MTLTTLKRSSQRLGRQDMRISNSLICLSRIQTGPMELTKARGTILLVSMFQELWKTMVLSPRTATSQSQFQPCSMKALTALSASMQHYGTSQSSMHGLLTGIRQFLRIIWIMTIQVQILFMLTLIPLT